MFFNQGYNSMTEQKTFTWGRHFQKRLQKRQESGLYRKLRIVNTPLARVIRIENKDFLHFSSNDYLGLAQDSRMTRAAGEALNNWTTGSGASPLITGRNLPGFSLEQELCEFKHAGSAIVFPSGYAANVGAISCLAGEGDLVLSDALNHASIIDGCRLSKAGVAIYPHCDVDYVKDLLAKRKEERAMVVTDSVFSMDGDMAPLQELNELCIKYGALLYVDDAHGTGVYGSEGAGVLRYLDTETENIVQMGTFSKAFGSLGGFVAGNELLVDYLINHCRSYIYSTALPPHVSAANQKALQISRYDSSLRDKLHALGAFLKDELEKTGVSYTGHGPHIFCIITGGAQQTFQLYDFLLERGIYIPPIRPPTVPENTSRLRVSLSAGHEFKDIEYLVQCLKDWFKTFG